MDAAKRRKIEESGWRVATVEEFLDLSPEDSAYIELKLALRDAMKRLRTARRLTQAQLARRMGTSQPNVARVESGDPAVSLDWLIRGLFALGASRSELAGIIQERRRRQTAPQKARRKLPRQTRKPAKQD
jgi:hypothetical protein